MKFVQTNIITININTPKISGNLSIKLKCRGVVLSDFGMMDLYMLLKKSVTRGNINFNHKNDETKTIVMIILLVKSTFKICANGWAMISCGVRNPQDFPPYTKHSNYAWIFRRKIPSN